MFFVEDNEGDTELVIKSQRNQFTNDFFLTNVMSFDCSAPPPPIINLQEYTYVRAPFIKGCSCCLYLLKMKIVHISI